jgi:hypothetical protein
MMQAFHFTILNLNHFKLAKDVELKVIASRSPTMVLPHIKFNPVYQSDQKLLGGTHRQRNRDTHTNTRQVGDLIFLIFIFGK